MIHPTTHRLALASMAFGAALIASPAALACDTCSCCDTDHSHGSDTHSHGFESGVSQMLARNVTATRAGASVIQRFIVVGDTQGGSGTSPFMPQLISSINQHNASHMILAGDLVGTGGSGTWNQWINSASAFSGGLENIYMTPGNHDQPVGTDALWQSTFDQTPGGQAWLPDSQALPTGPFGTQTVTGFDQMDYYVDQGSTRFISVTTDTSNIGASRLHVDSLAWMEAALADAEADNSIENVFVYTHHPVTFDSTYTPGAGGSTADRAGTQSDMWQSLVDDSSKVRALFTGHWHLYQPSTPDADNPDIWEVVSGTGGGGLEGRSVQNQHGFNVIDIMSDGVIQSTFYGDEDGSANGWEFNDIMDRFNIVDPNPAADGIVGYYSFNYGNRNLDTAPGPLAKQNHGGFTGDATTIGGGINGSALMLDGSGDYADGANFGDYNLAINGNLTLSIHASFDTLAGGGVENTLVAYGSALYDNNTPGSNELESEAVNIAYALRIRDDKRLEVLWERENGVDIVLTSTAAALVNAGEWHHYVVSRDIDTNELIFYVDGTQLGAAVSFTDAQQPTGGGSGFLHVGSSLYGDGSFDGMLDELTIYNDIRLPGQVYVGPKAGDINGDDGIDLADFDILLANFGEELADSGSLLTLALGDLDFDGDVDLFDFDAFQGAYLAANPGAAPLSVPEPGSLALLALGGLLIGRRRR